MHPSDKHDLGDLQLFTVPISRIDNLTEDVFVFYFERFFTFKTGQVVAITLKEDEPARLYSICSGEQEDEIGILFKIKPDGFLTPRLAQKKVGETLLVSQAFGAFYGTKKADYWIATGTGIAPFVSMLKSGLASNKTLIQGGRLEASFYYSNLFESAKDLNYLKCSSIMEKENYYHGRLTHYLKDAKLDFSKDFFVCGSSEMVVQVRDILIERGVEYEKIIAEIYF